MGASVLPLHGQGEEEEEKGGGGAKKRRKNGMGERRRDRKERPHLKVFKSELHLAWQASAP